MIQLALHDAVWTAVHAALDDRRDPLDDPRVILALETAPELLPEVALLRAALQAQPAPRARRVPLLRWAGVAAAAAFCIWIARLDTAVAPDPETSVVFDAPPPESPLPSASEPRGRVLFAQGSSMLASSEPVSGAVLEHRKTVFLTHP